MRKAALLAALAVLLLLAGRSVRVVAIDPEELLPRKDPARAEYERFLERFDDRRYGFIRIRHPEPADVVAISEEVSEFLLRQPAVSRVVSPQNARYFLGSEYFSLVSLFPRPIFNEDARDRLRFEVWRRTLFPDEPGSFVILFEFSSSAVRAQERELATATSAFFEKLGRKYPSIEVSIGGPRFLHGFLLERMALLLKMALPFALAIPVLIIALLFRSVSVSAWGFASAFMSAASSVLLLRIVSGGIGFFGIVAIVIGVTASAGGSVLLFSLLQRASGRLSQRLAEVRKFIERPVLAFVIAGAAAFLGYLMSRLAPERELGFVCALALLLAWLITFRALPYMLVETGFHPPARRWPFDRPLKAKAKTWKFGKIVAVLGSAAIFALSAFVSRHARPNEDILISLAPVRKIDVILRPKYWDVFDPDNQAELLALEQRIGDLPGVERVASLLALSDDLLSILAMRKPGQGEKLRKELLMTLDEAGALQDFRAPGAKETRTIVWLRPGAELEVVLDGLESLAKQVQGRVSVQVSGLAALRKALSTP